jgi:hypothetical protein
MGPEVLEIGMSKFSPTEAVFAGFRFARTRPAALLIWSAYYLVVLAVALVALFDLAGDKMVQLAALNKAGPADPGALLTVMDDIAPALGFAALLMMVFGAVMRAAVLRAYLEPDKVHPWAGLRFGSDELRVLGAYAFIMLALFCAVTFVSLLMSLAAQVSPGLAVFALGAGLAALAALAVRLSLAPMVAFTEKRISLRRSWQLTAGGFWPLAGAYVLLFAVAGVIIVVVLVLFGALLNVVQVWLSVVFLVAGLGVGVSAYRAFVAAHPKT